MIVFYHNPKCSKSRKALKFLQEGKEEICLIHYLESSLSFDEVEKLLKKLDMDPRDLLRKNEKKYKELNLDVSSLGRFELIQAIVDHPCLMQRPIVVFKDEAIIARPPEKVMRFL